MEVGAGYVTIYPDTSNFHEALASAVDGTLNDRTGQQAANSFFSPWQVAIGNLLADMGRTLIGSVGERMTEAIGRLDTLTNYPKVMEGFGYSAQEAEDSIELIMDRLVGLPTKTQEMVQFTQALADSTGDLDLATRGALAFNDALLATGASTVDQMRAQRIFNRIVGSGTATVNQWSALMSVMPLQLGMTSRAMLGAEASTEDLGIALREGKVSIEDILRTMVQLDEQGFEGMDSFNEQAWNMAFTLETALGLIPTRISNALAAIMGEIGRDNIMAPFLAMANGIKDAGNAIVYAIQWIKHMFDDELHSISDSLGTIGGYIIEFFTTFGTVVVGALREAAPIVIGFVDGALKAFIAAVQWFSENGASLAPLIVGVGTAFLIYQGLAFLGSIAGIINFQLIPALANALTSFGSMASSLMAFVTTNPILAIVMAIAGLVAALVTWITTTEEGMAWWNNFCATASAVFSAFGDLFMYIAGAIAGFFTETLPGALTAAGEFVGTFIEDVLLIIGTFATGILTAITMLPNAIVDIWKNIVNVAKKWWKNLTKEAKKAWDGLVKTVTGIVGGLVSAVTGFFGGIASTAAGIWDGMKSAASSAWNGIKSAASSIWGGIKSTIGGLVDGIKSAAGNAWNSMKSAASSAWDSMKSSASTVFNNIKSTIGNALDGARNLASSALSGIQGFINNLTGKTVNVTVKDGTPGGTANLVNNINNEIKKTRGTTVDINVRKTGINGIQLTPSYSGGRVTSMWATTMAKGGTITSPTIALIGEAGYNETVIPNTPWGVRPLAQAVAAEVSQSKGGVLITGNTFNVRNDRDIESVANRLNDMISRQNGGRL